MEPRALQRARDAMVWAPCAPAFVRQHVHELLERRGLLPEARKRLKRLLDGLEGTESSGWDCRFPAVAGPGAPAGMMGGILTIAALDPTVAPPRGARPASDVLDPTGLASIGQAGRSGLFVSGVPTVGDALVLGRSGSTAAWLAARAKETGRRIPADIVVSADLVAGPGGEPRLGAVAGGREKAAVVARELPGARLFLCGEHDGASNVTTLAEGLPVRELERLVWGNAAATDRTQVSTCATAARDAFEANDLAAAAPRYQQVVDIARLEDADLAFEACLRLAAICVHQGRSEDAGAWFVRADAVHLSKTKKGRYLVEQFTSLAGRAIDEFNPRAAREFLEERHAARAGEEDHSDPWERIQVLGAWRRLQLLQGHPDAARDVQIQLLGIAEDLERPRALVDLAWTEMRCGALAAARSSLLEAYDRLKVLPAVYRTQSLGFLTWNAGRLALNGGDVEGMSDLLDDGALTRLLGDPTLQQAPRWRIEALKAERSGEGEAIEGLIPRLTEFQRWHLGLFLLGGVTAPSVGLGCLAASALDLSGMPELAAERERVRSGGSADRGVFSRFSAY